MKYFSKPRIEYQTNKNFRSKVTLNKVLMICASWYMRIMEFSSLPFYFLLNALKIIPHKSLYQPFIGRTNIYYSRYALSKIKWDWNVGKSRVLHKFYDNFWKLNTSITVVSSEAISWLENCTLYYPPISVFAHRKYLNIGFSHIENEIIFFDNHAILKKRMICFLIFFSAVHL